MPYRFALEPQDYSDYASGRLLHALPGHPALPVRLTREVFQRCLARRHECQETGPCRLYDPCCGGAYHLCALAFLHRPALAELIASDLDEEALALAARNLALLTPEGLQQRRAEIAALCAAYGKESHRAALESADRLLRHQRQHPPAPPLPTRLFRADATDPARLAALLPGRPVDLVLADLPYGRQVRWQGRAAENPAWHLLEALQGVLAPAGLVALVADKQQKIAHPGYQRLEQFRLGKRQVVLSRLL
jgi:hypothetical protein